VVLHPGTTLLLFTDGLVERRGQVIDDGIGSLSTMLTDLGPPALRDPETLCDELFARLLPGWPDDDVGLLARGSRTAGLSRQVTWAAAWTAITRRRDSCRRRGLACSAQPAGGLGRSRARSGGGPLTVDPRHHQRTFARFT
jgi:Stage II sporulation protein E (SpoIIE)